jgi:hypothetical protein
MLIDILAGVTTVTTGALEILPVRSDSRQFAEWRVSGIPPPPVPEFDRAWCVCKRLERRRRCRGGGRACDRHAERFGVFDPPQRRPTVTRPLAACRPRRAAAGGLPHHRRGVRREQVLLPRVGAQPPQAWQRCGHCNRTHSKVRHSPLRRVAHYGPGVAAYFSRYRALRWLDNDGA